jgi:hypothetical protein
VFARFVDGRRYSFRLDARTMHTSWDVAYG